ncbi:MAG: hypothetical protein J2P37_25265 [Ktedonobacteraceae bacterium]|nr:hypothetical protein [Ktedonobacteraceae bacterium]
MERALAILVIGFLLAICLLGCLIAGAMWRYVRRRSPIQQRLVAYRQRYHPEQMLEGHPLLLLSTCLGGLLLFGGLLVAVIR